MSIIKFAVCVADSAKEQVSKQGSTHRIPTQQRIPRVGIDRTQHAVRARHGNVVLGLVSRQRGVIGFNVQFKVIRKSVLVQKAERRLGVVVVLVLGGFARFGFEEELKGVALLLLVLDGHAIERRHVVAFLFEVRVQEGLVTLATAPKDVIQASELVGNVLRMARRNNE